MEGPIGSLPTEILREILTLVVSPLPGRQVIYASPDGHLRTLPQPLALRHVCGTFRSLVDTLNFWYSNEFDFWDIFSETRLPWDIDHKRGLVSKMITVVLADERFAARLRDRKDSWKFSCAEHLSIALNTVSSKMRKVILHNFPDAADISSALDVLAVCPSLTKLAIKDERRRIFTVDLTLLGDRWPSLEELEVLGYIFLTGSLGNLRNLRGFRFAPQWMFSWAPGYVTPQMPTEMLTVLAIDADQQGVDPDLVQWFVHLKHLHFTPMVPILATFLASANIKLESFATSLNNESGLPSLLQVLRAPSLSELESFSFRVGYLFRWGCPGRSSRHRPNRRLLQHDMRSTCKEIVEAISMHLTSIRFLKIAIPLEDSWCRNFRTLTRLEVIECVMPDRYVEFRSYAQYDDEFEWGEADEEIYIALQSAVSDFDRKPQISVTVAKETLFYTDPHIVL